MDEPWLRGTLAEVDAVRRQVLHALELAEEDVERWCRDLSDEEMHGRPFGVASVAYQMRHMVRSLDRLLTYAEGRQLSEEQLRELGAEMRGGVTGLELFREFGAEMRGGVTGLELFREFGSGLEGARRRVMEISPRSFEEQRGVGRKMLPTTVGGLLVHCAEHTQRHVGQAVTTAKVLVGLRGG